MTNIPENTISVYITAKDTGQKVEQVNLSHLLTTKTIESPTIKLNKNGTRQEILGFGGAFTEAAASVYHKLDTEKKEEIIQAYFGANGNGYNMGRTHINSCDFSLSNYSYCDKPDDTELNDFSISRDKELLIPFVQDALNHAKTPIHILASPWSPPAWMKTNGQMNHGGKLKKEFRDVWARYYCKYIKAYEKENILIWGISVQNEPAAKQTWDSCIYTAEEERDFIRDHLGPALESRGLLDKKVIIWDHNRDIMVERARIVLNDPEAAKYVWGTGFHWYNGDHFEAVQQVHDEFPDKELIFTEGCQENGPHIGSWNLGERYATSIINDLNRWTVAWIDWNLILDENGGPNHVGNYCSAPIIVDTNTQEVLYQSSYYYLGHFSRFIKRGDRIIGCENKTDDLLALASINDSGVTTTILMNKNNTQKKFIYMDGNVILDLCIPSRSIVTLINA
ncbi:MAG: glucosylceramidase [Candidatus Marinimicrobia bacterium]|nr:glucosylceramidase [Candidatus Neomarinimicrobiota bacterium]